MDDFRDILGHGICRPAWVGQLSVDNRRTVDKIKLEFFFTDSGVILDVCDA
jgi:hypothetical protein